jgi:hypothetical protein
MIDLLEHQTSPNAALIENVLDAIAGHMDRAHLRPNPTVLPSGSDAIVIRLGDLIAKGHPSATDTNALAARLRLVSQSPMHSVFQRPVCASPVLTRCGRLVTIWMAGEPLAPESIEDIPWEHAGLLLAQLHRTPIDASGAATPLPPAGGPRRFARAIASLNQADDSPAKQIVLAAFKTLTAGDDQWTTEATNAAKWTKGRTATIVHGDWHPGQIVRVTSPGHQHTWRLVDIDDLGIGDPAWDLARPAAWFAAGLLAPESWMRFIDAYRQAGGPAVPQVGDPWECLDLQARALVIQSAALAVTKSQTAGRPLHDSEEFLIESCSRIVTSPQLESQDGSVEVSQVPRCHANPQP